MELNDVGGTPHRAASPARKSYGTPSLTVFGPVGSLTQNLMFLQNVDGGNPGMPKTS